VNLFKPNHNTFMTSAVSSHRHLATWWLGSCALVSWSSAAWSAESAGALALKALLGPQAAFQQMGGLPPTPAHSAGGAEQASPSAMASAPLSAPAAMTKADSMVTVQRGETLDRIIRRVLPDVPLHPDFLRKAFVSLNPQVFPSGSPHQMRSGVPLQVPSMPALRQMVLSQHPRAAPLFQGAEEQAQHKAAPEPSDQRRWVRYP
jgi:Tfp pilus assembly protein FimV